MDIERALTEAFQQSERTWTRKLAITLQPDSMSDFNAHPEFEEIFRLFTQGDRYRGMDLGRMWSLILNIKQTLNSVPGSLAEVGVYYGHSSAILSHYARTFGRKMYLADTFEGFAEEQYEEGMSEGKIAAFKDATIAKTQAIVGDYEGNRWVVGMFPQSVTAEMREDRYSFVSIDCDIYQPIHDGLNFFWPRLNPRGMIFVHDYSSGHWPGATRAVDEFCQREKVAGIVLPDLSGSYALVKQG